MRFEVVQMRDGKFGVTDRSREEEDEHGNAPPTRSVILDCDSYDVAKRVTELLQKQHEMEPLRSQFDRHS